MRKNKWFVVGVVLVSAFAMSGCGKQSGLLNGGAYNAGLTGGSGPATALDGSWMTDCVPSAQASGYYEQERVSILTGAFSWELDLYPTISQCQSRSGATSSFRTGAIQYVGTDASGNYQINWVSVDSNGYSTTTYDIARATGATLYFGMGSASASQRPTSLDFSRAFHH